MGRFGGFLIYCNFVENLIFLFVYGPFAHVFNAGGNFPTICLAFDEFKTRHFVHNKPLFNSYNTETPIKRNPFLCSNYDEEKFWLLCFHGQRSVLGIFYVFVF